TYGGLRSDVVVKASELVISQNEGGVFRRDTVHERINHERHAFRAHLDVVGGGIGVGAMLVETRGGRGFNLSDLGQSAIPHVGEVLRHRGQVTRVVGRDFLSPRKIPNVGQAQQALRRG